MKPTRLMNYKSRIPVILDRRIRKDCRIFHSEELNRMIDENIAVVRREGYARLNVPSRLHPIRPEQLSENARRTAEKLLAAGYQAYLCGGAVRDLLREEEVKDFDLATNASNEQLAALFEEMKFFSIPTGHRFGCLEFGEEVVDVTTFTNIPASYKGLPHVPDFDEHSLYSDQLLFDAFQRDMSINMLYYDVATGDVIDFFGGLYCLREGLIENVVPSSFLFRIDPRRAIRAVRFAARFGFDLSDAADAALRAEGAEYMRRLDPASCALELPDFYAGGFARLGTELLMEYNMFGELFPAARKVCSDPAYIEYALRTALGADWLYEEGTWALPMIVMAALLWPAVREAREAGAENPAEQVFETQRAVMDMSEKDAEYFLATLSMEGAENRSREELRRETETIFAKPEFKEGLRMLGLHYMAYTDRQ